VHTKVGSGDLKGAAGTGAGLFKDEGDALALAKAMRDARLFVSLELGCKVDQPRDLVGGEVKELEKALLVERVHIYSSIGFMQYVYYTWEAGVCQERSANSRVLDKRSRL
jgi:hypothetical protein